MKQLAQKLLQWIVSLVIIAVVFGVINLVSVGGQKLWHSGDQAKLDVLKTELDSQQGAIAATEEQLQQIKNEMERVVAEADQVKALIRKYERLYPSGIPSESYANYEWSVARHNELVGEHNSFLLTFNTLHNSYSQQIDAYNDKVGQANALSEEIGGTWYVVPVPRGKSGSRGPHETAAPQHQ